MKYNNFSSLLNLLRDIWENNVLIADQNLTSPKVQGLKHVSQGSHSPNFGPFDILSFALYTKYWALYTLL